MLTFVAIPIFVGTVAVYISSGSGLYETFSIVPWKFSQAYAYFYESFDDKRQNNTKSKFFDDLKIRDGDLVMSHSDGSLLFTSSVKPSPNVEKCSHNDKTKASACRAAYFKMQIKYFIKTLKLSITGVQLEKQSPLAHGNCTNKVVVQLPSEKTVVGLTVSKPFQTFNGRIVDVSNDCLELTAKDHFIQEHTSSYVSGGYVTYAWQTKSGRGVVYVGHTSHEAYYTPSPGGIPEIIIHGFLVAMGTKIPCVLFPKLEEGIQCKDGLLLFDFTNGAADTLGIKMNTIFKSSKTVKLLTNTSRFFLQSDRTFKNYRAVVDYHKGKESIGEQLLLDGNGRSRYRSNPYRFGDIGKLSNEWSLSSIGVLNGKLSYRKWIGTNRQTVALTIPSTMLGPLATVSLITLSLLLLNLVTKQLIEKQDPSTTNEGKSSFDFIEPAGLLDKYMFCKYSSLLYHINYGRGSLAFQSIVLCYSIFQTSPYILVLMWHTIGTTIFKVACTLMYYLYIQLMSYSIYKTFHPDGLRMVLLANTVFHFLMLLLLSATTFMIEFFLDDEVRRLYSTADDVVCVDDVTSTCSHYSYLISCSVTLLPVCLLTMVMVFRILVRYFKTDSTSPLIKEKLTSPEENMLCVSLPSICDIPLRLLYKQRKKNMSIITPENVAMNTYQIENVIYQLQGNVLWLLGYISVNKLIVNRHDFVRILFYSYCPQIYEIVASEVSQLIKGFTVSDKGTVDGSLKAIKMRCVSNQTGHLVQEISIPNCV